MLDYYKDNQDKLKQDEKETKKIKKIVKKGDVKAVLDEFDDVFKYFFEFYCRSEDHRLG